MKKQRRSWLFIGILILTILLLVAIIVLVHDAQNSKSYTPIVFDANESPEVLVGSSHEYIVGPDLGFGYGYSGGPPKVEFQTDYCFAVHASVTNTYPGLYETMSGERPTSYRLIQMKTIDVFRGIISRRTSSI